MIKPALGTVQIGMPYGNQSQKSIMSEEEALGILNAAETLGIRFWDTAVAYGESEVRIGKYLQKFPHSAAQVSTKIPSTSPEIYQSEKVFFEFLITCIEQSRQKLGLINLDLLQFHQCSVEFLTRKSVISSMRRLMSEGHCSQLGVSVYQPSQAEAAAEIDCISWLQIPVNILDRRFISEEMLVRFRRKKIKLIARSIFLQGLLVPGADVPEVVKKEKLQELKRLIGESCEADSVDSKVASLFFIFVELKKDLYFGLLGADSESTIRENMNIIESFEARKSPASAGKTFSAAINFARENDLLDPSTWNLR